MLRPLVVLDLAAGTQSEVFRATLMQSEVIRAINAEDSLCCTYRAIFAMRPQQPIFHSASGTSTSLTSAAADARACDALWAAPTTLH